MCFAARRSLLSLERPAKTKLVKEKSKVASGKVEEVASIWEVFTAGCREGVRERVEVSCERNMGEMSLAWMVTSGGVGRLERRARVRAP